MGTRPWVVSGRVDLCHRRVCGRALAGSAVSEKACIPDCPGAFAEMHASKACSQVRLEEDRSAPVVRQGLCPSAQDHRAWTISTCCCLCYLCVAVTPEPAALDRPEMPTVARPTREAVLVGAAFRRADGRRAPGSAEASLAAAWRDVLQRWRISTSCSGVANENESEGGAASAREDRIVVGSSRADQMVVVDRRNTVDQPVQKGPRADKAGAAADVAAVDVVDAAAAAAASVSVSWMAEMVSGRKATQRFVKMGRARAAVVVVLDPSSR